MSGTSCVRAVCKIRRWIVSYGARLAPRREDDESKGLSCSARRGEINNKRTGIKTRESDLALQESTIEPRRTMKHYLLAASLFCLSVTLATSISVELPTKKADEEQPTTALKMATTPMKKRLPQAADRVKDEQESVWVEFIQLALETKPLNLGQGFPDFAAPKYLLESLREASTNGSNPASVLNNQYTRSFGHPRLVRALQRYYNEFRGFRELEEPNEQILITVGAYEALFATMMAFVNPGDEVLIIEPAFDAYAPIVAMAQAKSVFVPLRLSAAAQQSNGSSARLSSADFGLDMREFASKISERTRLLVLNTPNNPLGKMYSMGELEQLAELCRAHNILVLADEVYEQMYYAPGEHLSIAKLPGMWERTITVGSAGKTFSVTGWKIGWALGPRELIRFVQLIHQTAIYTVATPLQEAIARAFEHEMEAMAAANSTTETKDYWHELRSDLVRKRERMAGILERAQLRPVVPEGGYFMLADFSRLAERFPEYLKVGESSRANNSNDYRFARWLSREQKLQGIPGGAFYSASNKRLGENLLRFCFIKQEATLDGLERILEKLAASAHRPKL